jgi:hypothetical protein
VPNEGAPVVVPSKTCKKSQLFSILKVVKFTRTLAPGVEGQIVKILVSLLE